MGRKTVVVTNSFTSPLIRLDSPLRYNGREVRNRTAENVCDYFRCILTSNSKLDPQAQRGEVGLGRKEILAMSSFCYSTIRTNSPLRYNAPESKNGAADDFSGEFIF